MRLFKTRLAAKSNIPNLKFDLKTSKLKQLALPNTLDHLTITPNKNVKLDALINTIVTIPMLQADISRKSNGRQVLVTGLKDIYLEMQEATSRVLREDPSFFLRLRDHQEQAELNNTSEEDAVTSTLTTTASCNYFATSGLRFEGVQHTTDLVLKRLHQSSYISTEDFMSIMPDFWAAVSKLREKELANKKEHKLPEEPFVPFVFRA